MIVAKRGVANGPIRRIDGLDIASELVSTFDIEPCCCISLGVAGWLSAIVADRVCCVCNCVAIVRTFRIVFEVGSL